MPSIKGFSLNGNNYNLTIDSLGDLSKYNAETITESDDLSNLLSTFFSGLDINNVLKSGSPYSYTATENAFCFIVGGSYCNVMIDGVNKTGSINNGGWSSNYMLNFPVKKGSTVSVTGGTPTVFQFYGLK